MIRRDYLAPGDEHNHAQPIHKHDEVTVVFVVRGKYVLVIGYAHFICSE